MKSSYDVVVVGGGAIGLACAWRAAQRGLSVLVAERERPGAGASGSAAGMLAPVTEAHFGEEELLGLNLRSADLWPAFAAELSELSGRDTGYRRRGAIVAAADRDDVEELQRLHAFQRSLGLAAEWLAGSECRKLEPALSPRVGGGILAPQDGQVDPRALVESLADALAGAGGELRSGTGVAELVSSDERVVGVRLEDGTEIAAGEVLLAAGCWSGGLGGLPPGAAPPVRPVKGQILRLRGPVPLTERMVRTPRSYIVDRGDGRVVVGATVEERGFDVRVTAEGVFRLLEAAWEVLPEIGELELVEAVAGLRPGSPDNRPLIGRSEVEGLVLATGHYRNGILLAPLTAELVAGVLAGEELPEHAACCSPRRPLAAAGAGRVAA